MMREGRLPIPKPVGLWGAYAMGLAFAFGWTPCIGPILAAILSVAAAEATVTKGAMLLAVYSAGLGIPFLIAAFMVEQFSALFARMKRHLAMVERAMGVLLVVTGIGFLDRRGHRRQHLAAGDVSGAAEFRLGRLAACRRCPMPGIFELHGDEVGRAAFRSGPRLPSSAWSNAFAGGSARPPAAAAPRASWRRPDRAGCAGRCGSVAHRQCRQTSRRGSDRCATRRPRRAPATLRPRRAQARCRAARLFQKARALRIAVSANGRVNWNAPLS